MASHFSAILQDKIIKFHYRNVSKRTSRLNWVSGTLKRDRRAKKSGPVESLNGTSRWNLNLYETCMFKMRTVNYSINECEDVSWVEDAAILRQQTRSQIVVYSHIRLRFVNTCHLLRCLVTVSFPAPCKSAFTIWHYITLRCRQLKMHRPWTVRWRSTDALPASLLARHVKVPASAAL